LEVYRVKEKVNYMIHGHATLKPKEYSFWTGTTKKYRLCGDYREAFEILDATHDQTQGILTLRNHGFLIFAESIEQIETMISEAEFEMRVE
jgi:UDP-2,3-diacylglucosamine pyrophosphatase LpxH